MSDETQGQITEREAAWVSAYLAKDADRFAALLDDGFIYSSERGVFHKPEYVANLASGALSRTAN
jgi:hypothetical protein